MPAWLARSLSATTNPELDCCDRAETSVATKLTIMMKQKKILDRREKSI